MDQERRREHVAQEAEPRHDRRERVGLGRDVEELDLEDVAGLRALDEDRTGERMNRARFHLGHIGLGGAGPQLAVDTIARRQDDLFALVHGDERRNVRVKPVVTGRRLISQSLAAVDLDAFH